MMQFDTRDKKPTLWPLAELSAVTAAGLSFGILTGRGSAVLYGALLDIYLFFVLLILLWTCREQIRYNPYSYNTILYFGFSLFTLSVLVTHVALTAQTIVRPGQYDELQIFSVLQRSAANYMLLSFPFILAFSAGLCVSNLSLIRHEGRRPVNLLGILLSVLMIGGEIFLMFFRLRGFNGAPRSFLHELAGSLFAACYLYFECMLLGVMFANVLVTRYQPDPDKDFLIILGCGLRKDGTPTPLLAGRIDCALDFARMQKEKTGKDVTFIPSGGQGGDEAVSESEAMSRYLLAHGVPEERILREERATNTFENMKFSKRIIDEVNPEGKVAYATTNYHVFRSGIYARRVKMRAVGVGARTKWYFWPNAAVREFTSLLTAHRGKQAAVLCGMLAVYTLLTWLAYVG